MLLNSHATGWMGYQGVRARVGVAARHRLGRDSCTAWPAGIGGEWLDAAAARSMSALAAVGRRREPPVSCSRQPIWLVVQGAMNHATPGACQCGQGSGGAGGRARLHSDRGLRSVVPIGGWTKDDRQSKSCPALLPLAVHSPCCGMHAASGGVPGVPPGGGAAWY